MENASLPVKIYGIKNCDAMKKSLKWLEGNNIEFRFHDYKKEAVTSALVEQWLTTLPLDKLINTRGTTWRKLPEALKENLTIESGIKLIIENTSLIKRPLLDVEGQYYLGFSAEEYAQIFSN